MRTMFMRINVTLGRQDFNVLRNKMYLLGCPKSIVTCEKFLDKGIYQTMKPLILCHAQGDSRIPGVCWRRDFGGTVTVLELGEETPMIATPVASFWWHLFCRKPFPLPYGSSTLGLGRKWWGLSGLDGTEIDWSTDSSINGEDNMAERSAGMMLASPRRAREAFESEGRRGALVFPSWPRTVVLSRISTDARVIAPPSAIGLKHDPPWTTGGTCV